MLIAIACLTVHVWRVAHVWQNCHTVAWGQVECAHCAQLCC